MSEKVTKSGTLAAVFGKIKEIFNTKADMSALNEKAYGRQRSINAGTQGWYRVATVNYAPNNPSAIFAVNQPWANSAGDGFIMSICSRHDNPPDMIQLGRALRGDINAFPKCRCVYGWDKVYFDIYYNYNVTNNITINSISDEFLLNDITYLGNEDTSGVDDGYNTKVFELARQGIKADVITSPSLDLKLDKSQYGEDILWSGDTTIDDIITINLSKDRSNYRYLALQFYVEISGIEYYQPSYNISQYISNGNMVEFVVYDRFINISINPDNLVLEDVSSSGTKYIHLVKVIGVK